MPLARLIHSFDDDAIALCNANFDQGMKIAKATSAKESWPGKGPVVPTSHLHGGAIMGTRSENSVTNSFGQTHEIPNLWMAGPCIFPSEGASNPTYTIFAVSQRGAENLAKNFGTVAG
jgi:choline dehydrogenase-like flavoprotein